MSTKIIRILAAERKNEEMVPNVTKVRAFFFFNTGFYSYFNILEIKVNLAIDGMYHSL